MLKFNARWAAKLEKQRRREQERAERAAKEREAEEQQKEKERVNPFAQAQTGGGLFGGGSLFDAQPTTPAPVPEPESESDYDDEERLAEELAIKASLAEQQSELGGDSWAASGPAYGPPQYLGTIPEPAEEAAPPPAPAPASAGDTTPTADPGEKYEKMLLDGIDSTFERFVRRISPEPRQIVRYEFGGAPLPYSQAGALYRALWPGDRYNGEVPPCSCGAPRVYELQLMPNLVNILRRESLQGVPPLASEEARRVEVEGVLGVGSGAGSDAKDAVQSGIAWTTAMVFVCSADCAGEHDEGWREEYVGVQFDGDI